jgi:hypothetical protein
MYHTVMYTELDARKWGDVNLQETQKDVGKATMTWTDVEGG